MKYNVVLNQVVINGFSTIRGARNFIKSIVERNNGFRDSEILYLDENGFNIIKNGQKILLTIEDGE